jgi:hypothetical protein
MAGNKKMHLKCVNGMTGVQLNKVIQFLTGEKALNYDFDKEQNKFVFTVRKSLVPEEKLNYIKYFEEFFHSKVELL